MAALAVVRDLREHWAPASAEELKQFETDALFGFVLARASAGLADGTIRGDVGHLDQSGPGTKDAQLRIPPSEPEVGTLFAGWGGELATCRKFAPTARNYTASKLLSQVGLRVSEACGLDLDDIKWDLGRFGKLHGRHGKGTRGSGPRERMVPLINGADRTLRWFIEDVWGQFDDDHTRLGAPLFP
ncbi:site-specific integrase [Streptomyces kaniharaensis]|uniref:site-specific integrase n=1 Tax=Streptomyces kaniharaensis TaxID=212423 RepID=UPI001E3A1907|nr:site-specific integrase [Streptomyces kaniharaensis]